MHHLGDLGPDGDRVTWGTILSQKTSRIYATSTMVRIDAIIVNEDASPQAVHLGSFRNMVAFQTIDTVGWSTNVICGCIIQLVFQLEDVTVAPTMHHHRTGA